MNLKNLKPEYYETDDETVYDFTEIENIVSALSFLRLEARKTGNHELYTLINSAFNLCYTSYQLALKMSCLPSTGSQTPNS